MLQPSTADGGELTLLAIYKDKLTWVAAWPTQTELLVIDNTDDYHTFRIAKEPGLLEFSLWRDGVLVAENLVSGADSLNRLILGDIGGGWGAGISVDYLRFTEGAFAPTEIPEPATILLIGLGALCLIPRKRR